MGRVKKLKGLFTRESVIMNDNGTVCIMLSAIIKYHRFEMYMLYTFQIYGKDERCLRSIYT